MSTKFNCDVLNDFYKDHDVKFKRYALDDINKFTNENITTRIDVNRQTYNLLEYIIDYSYRLPKSKELFEYLINCDVDINAASKTTTNQLLHKLLHGYHNDLLDKYVSSRYFDKNDINRQVMVNNKLVYPIDTVTLNNRYNIPKLNMLIQLGAKVPNNLEKAIIALKPYNSEQIEAAVDILKFIKSSNPVEKIILAGFIDSNPTYIKKVLKENKDLDIKYVNESGHTFLHLFCTSGSLYSSVAGLIKKGIDINAVDKKGYDALLYFVTRSRDSLTKQDSKLFDFLLLKGINTNRIYSINADNVNGDFHILSVIVLCFDLNNPDTAKYLDAIIDNIDKTDLNNLKNIVTDALMNYLFYMPLGYINTTFFEECSKKHNLGIDLEQVINSMSSKFNMKIGNLTSLQAHYCKNTFNAKNVSELNLIKNIGTQKPGDRSYYFHSLIYSSHITEEAKKIKN